MADKFLANFYFIDKKVFEELFYLVLMFLIQNFRAFTSFRSKKTTMECVTLASNRFNIHL